MLEAAPTLVLFDIDGTLISTNGKAGAAFGEALEHVFGTRGPIQNYRWAGKTDPQIARDLMTAAGIAPGLVEVRLPSLFARYLVNLAATLDSRSVTVLGGVPELLDLLEKHEVTVGLLTGNIAGGAEIKLRAAGLFERFRFGAYGSDSADRDRLVPVALERARRSFGRPFTTARTVVVGDAEADIRCARAGGARAVAVASGWTPADVLARLEPDALLPSLAPPASLAAILGT
jgi:phosphoglycolate phosphatase-like HAD superfamily hydrolase